MTQANSAIEAGNCIARKSCRGFALLSSFLQSMEGWSTKPTFPLYYFQMKMRREFFIPANVNETQRSSATLSGMNGRQKGKGASRWRR